VETQFTVAREIKDTLFSILLGTAEGGRELYDAFVGEPLPADLEVKPITLDTAVYTDQRDDVAHLIGDLFIFIYDQMSTINPSMPLRDLFYGSLTYDKYVSMNKLNLYSSKKVSLPRPRFIVLYNGSKAQPAKEILRLSDLYPPQIVNKDDELGSLELTVVKYNINHSDNADKINRSPLLQGYVYIVQRLEYYRELGLTDREAVNRLIEDCLTNNILVEFLLERKEEVFGMLCTQYDRKLELETIAGELAEERVEKVVYERTEQLRQEVSQRDAELKRIADEYATYRAQHQ
jgi:hypothetical protein